MESKGDIGKATLTAARDGQRDFSLHDGTTKFSQVSGPVGERNSMDVALKGVEATCGCPRAVCTEVTLLCPAIFLVRPETVVKWHRAGFRSDWRRKSRPKGGRPRIDPEVSKLIRDMWNMNPTWGRPRIQSELAKLGITVGCSTVARYKPKRRRPPSQSWRTFLDNHAQESVAFDFFTVVPRQN